MSLIAGAATLADTKKMHAFGHALRESLPLTDTVTITELGFAFEPTAVDTLGAPSEQVVEIVNSM